MERPVQITFRDMEPSEAVEIRIREEVAKLETFFDGIIGCHVVVEIPHHHKQHGNLFHVSIDLSVPGDELVVRHEPSLGNTLKKTASAKIPKTARIGGQYEDLYVAIRDGFKAMRRKLREYISRKRDAKRTTAGKELEVIEEVEETAEAAD